MDRSTEKEERPESLKKNMEKEIEWGDYRAVRLFWASRGCRPLTRSSHKTSVVE